MKREVPSLFSDKSGVSMMRVMSFVCVMTAICVAITGVFRENPDYLGLSEICGTFLAAAFAGKAYQKKVELASK